jgi:hypothetical protein
MRSQVQVLAGPPPITPGQSAVGSKPRALAASLGRAGAACPSSPAPPGTPTRGVRHHDHHAPWSPPSPRRQPRGRCATSRRSLFPCPPSSRQPPVLRTPAWPACSLIGHAPPCPTRPGSATNPTDQRDLAAPPASRLAGPSTEPVNGAAAHRDSTRSRGDGCPPQRPGPNATARYGRRRTRPDRRGGQQPAGHRTGGQQTAGRWTGGHQRAGHRTGGQQTTTAGHPDDEPR